MELIILCWKCLAGEPVQFITSKPTKTASPYLYLVVPIYS